MPTSTPGFFCYKYFFRVWLISLVSVFLHYILLAFLQNLYMDNSNLTQPDHWVFLFHSKCSTFSCQTVILINPSFLFI